MFSRFPEFIVKMSSGKDTSFKFQEFEEPLTFFPHFIGKMPSEEEEGVLSNYVVAGTLDFGETGPQSFTKFYREEDEKIWNYVSKLFRKSVERERICYAELCEFASILDELFKSRYAPQFSRKALDLVMSDDFRPNYEWHAEETNLKFLHLPENATLLKEVQEACDKRRCTVPDAVRGAILFDWHIGCAMKQAVMKPNEPIENGEVIDWVHRGCAIEQAARIQDDEKPRLTPALLYATLDKYRNFSANQIYLFGKKVASLPAFGGVNHFLGVQRISGDFVQKLNDLLSKDGILYRVVTNRTSTVGIVAHTKFHEELVMVELPEKCGDTCAFLLRGVLFISVYLTSEKKDLSKPGQENHEDQYEELMEFCKAFPTRVVVGNFGHNIISKLDGFQYAFPKCESDPDTVHCFRTDMQTQHADAGKVEKMKKDFILISCPGIDVDIIREHAKILGDPSVVSRDAYLPHLQHPMPHLYVEADLFIRNGPTYTVTKTITAEAHVSKETGV